MQRQRILPVTIEEEMRGSYLDYSMSVIVSRALPDVRDGLKPVHRRVLYGMHELGLQAGKPHKKSARVVGEVLGKFHPHGDSAVYDSLVRMVQDFSLRYPLIDGQGNFGSVDGDSPAAMRYTEVRMKAIAGEMLKDLDKETVEYSLNFDDSLEEPTVLPSSIPNLLVNGASGIAVGMATNIPPQNLREVVDGMTALIDNPDIEIEELMKHVIAPDFPTGGIIYGYEGVRLAYTTGRGKVVIRARALVEVTQKNGRESIVVTELPYQVNKVRLIEKIVELVHDKKVEGIADIRDESDRDGMRLVIELKRDAVAKVVLNNLYKHTPMQDTFGVIMLALVDGVPRVLNLKEMMQFYIQHRNEIVLRRTRYDLTAAEKRAHILEGLKICLDNLDEVITTIRESPDANTAQARLIERFGLSELQSKAILEMRLQRLTGMERKKIDLEYAETIALIEELRDILASPERQMQIIRTELLKVREVYGDERRTEIVPQEGDFSIEDMIAQEDVVITITHDGFIKRFPVSGYRRQARGGKGVTGAQAKNDDFIEHMFVASTHNYILFFTSNGRCYWLKVYEIPEAGRAARGRSLANIMELNPGETIKTYINIRNFDEPGFIMMATADGIVKKTALEEFSRPRRNGIAAITIDTGDALLDARLTDGDHQVILAKSSGLVVRFPESQVRPMGRTAMGVKGITLDRGEKCISMVTTKRLDTALLAVTDNGFGKRSKVEDYRLTKRGARGVITLKAHEKIGALVGLLDVNDDDDLIIITSHGIVNRQHVSDIRITGRNTSGVRLVRLMEGDTVSALARVPKTDEDTDTETLLEDPDGQLPLL
ncbi:DNA gyrase subunit A [Chlorobium phaeovibrioides]|uniref:DNA gyrase subunit A n=1 Tax=Chlorobium phaeovibrioides TaxID=1094 RepID=A0A5M8I8R9_CHLPH|nr:DNA gyrase subunit A [Chlorobium phaeovibrioides]KAA6231833.1 DNA gyrase subunit A [Chlorobium phaeovibrioides]MWV54189.1 DNA gyrase subunit A [Chlorobium phaeovibrioides]QEQ57609.1 DNA gyrase subunit A [Chlorobium phaeovibrioides]RTY34608.1 DNA gyrase subunit A [Chlorobium phaeovibrioides]